MLFSIHGSVIFFRCVLFLQLFSIYTNETYQLIGRMRLSSIRCLAMLMFAVMTNGAKFVAFTAQTKSHIHPILAVARQLKQYNHSVTVVVSSEMKEALESEGFMEPYVIAKSLDKTSFFKSIQRALTSKMAGDRFNALFSMLKGANDQCESFMKDEDVYTILKAERFDYALVDLAPVLCFEVMAYKLSLPFISIGSQIDAVQTRTPFNPSFMPSFWSGLTDKMTFSQRIINSLLFFVHLSKPPMPSFSNLVDKFVPEKPYVSNHQLKNSGLLHIANSDNLLDYPIPYNPNVILCGGLAANPAKPLPANIEKFMQKSPGGVVVVSFGSIIKACPPEIIGKMLSSFHKLKNLSFIFRHGTKEEQRENVLLLPWLPQNDLMGHSKTKLLITHCGKNSLFEAIFHGVPVIGFPMALDQKSNSVIIENKGYGISMDILEVKVEELVQSIERVVFTESYRMNIQQASQIFHSRPQTPAERAAYWIDLVTKYGTKHFRPASLDMPWYSYYMVDVFLFYIIVTILLIYLIVTLFKICCRCCRNKKTMKEKHE